MTFFVHGARDIVAGFLAFGVGSLYILLLLPHLQPPTHLSAANQAICHPTLHRHPLHPLHRLLHRLLLFPITAHIRHRLRKYHIRRNLDDKVQPKQINRLQTRQQRKCDDLAEATLVLLGFPVEVEGTNGGEGGEDGEKDDEVDVVAEVDPDTDEEGEVGDREG